MTREGAGLLGAGLVIGAAACFATLGPLTRLAEDAGVEPLGFAAWRSAVGAALMMGVLGVRRAVGRRELVGLSAVPPRSRAIMLLAAVATTTLNLAIFIAFTRISVGLSLLVFYLYPALVALAGAAWFDERLDAIRWGALALSLVGMVLVVVGPIGTLDALGIALAFVAALSQAVYVLAARHGYGSVPSMQASTFFLTSAALAYVVIAAVSGNAGALTGPLSLEEAWPLLLIAGTVGAGLPTVAYMMGIRRVGASRASILATVEPVVGVLLAAVMLSEIPSPLQIAGGVLVLTAAALLQMGRRPEPPHEAAVDPS